MHKLLLVGAALAAFSAVPSQAATQIYSSDVDGLAGNQPWNGTLGLNFDVNAPIVITSLGVFDDSSDGLQATLAVTIFDRATQQQLFSPVIFSSGTANTGNEYIFQSIAPLILRRGAYQLAAWNYDANEQNYNNSGPGGPITFNDLGGRLTAVGTSYSNAGGVYGNQPDVGLTRYGAGSLMAAAIPEPATWAMLIGGFGVVGGAMRSARRNRKAAIRFA